MQLSRLQRRYVILGNVASWKFQRNSVLEFSSSVVKFFRLFLILHGHHLKRLLRHAENWIILQTKENSIVANIFSSDNNLSLKRIWVFPCGRYLKIFSYLWQLFSCQKFFGFPWESGRVVTTNQVWVSPGATLPVLADFQDIGHQKRGGRCPRLFQIISEVKMGVVESES